MVTSQSLAYVTAYLRGHTFFYYSHCTIYLLANDACTSINYAGNNKNHPRSTAAIHEKVPNYSYFQRKQDKYTGCEDPKADNPRDQIYLRHA
jgi:hypothetical protein